MLATTRRPSDALKGSGSIFAFVCFGCKEVFLPEDEIDAFLRENAPLITGKARVDYLCEERFAAAYLEKNREAVASAAAVVVFSCGVGVQAVARLIPDRVVTPGCDTHYINGFQGLAPQPADCRQCGECFLNETGGICPLTACSKGLLNGQCGGAKNGKCEVNEILECGWERIYRRLAATGRTRLMGGAKSLARDYSKIIAEVRARKEQP